MGTSSLGTIGNIPFIGNYFTLSASQPTDVFKFQIDSTRNINLSLTDITAGDDADLILYRDNGDGIFGAGDQFVASSSRSSNEDDSINKTASAGTYFAQVNRYSPGNSGDVNYDLAISATALKSTSDFSNLLPKEVELGLFSASSPNNVTHYGSLSDSNTADVYHFSVGYGKINIRLTGLTSDADIRLIQDHNPNQIVGENEEVARSTNGGAASEVIYNITGSNCFLQVNQYSGNTNYTLNFEISPIIR